MLYIRKEEVESEIFAVSVEAVALGSEKEKMHVIDPDFGVGIDVKIGAEVESYMANWRKYQCWCSPHFGSDFKDMPDKTQMLVIKLKTDEFAVFVPVLAAVNIDSENRAVKAEISASDIDGFCADEVAVYEHFSKELKILKKGESFDVELKDNDDYKLYIFVPIKDGFAVIGRTDKFISPKTIANVYGETVHLTEDGPYAYVKDGKLYLK